MTKKHSRKSPDAQVKLEIAKNDSLIRTYGWEYFAKLGVFCTFQMKITPAYASDMLAKNQKNRNKKPGFIKLMTEEMLAGTWFLTHQGVAFRDNGELADGQNRLQAIINSGKPQNILVTFGVTQEAMLVIDTHRVRTDADALKIDGLETIRTSHTAVAKRMMGTYGRAVSRTVLKDFYILHEKHIRIACELLSKSGISHAAIKCVIARALYHLDFDVLEKFCGILNNPFHLAAEDHEGIPIFLYRWYTGLDSRSGEQISKIIYARTEWSLDRFAKKKAPLKGIKEATTELYPLPEEQQ